MEARQLLPAARAQRGPQRRCETEHALPRPRELGGQVETRGRLRPIHQLSPASFLLVGDFGNLAPQFSLAALMPTLHPAPSVSPALPGRRELASVPPPPLSQTRCPAPQEQLPL